MQQKPRVSLLLVVLLVTPALAFDKQPKGVGKADFGMSPAQVEKAYKDKFRRLDKEHLGATPVYNPDIVRDLIEDQRLIGLEQPVNIELRFWKDKLWVAIVYYGKNPNEKVNEALRREYGTPDQTGKDAIWKGDKVMVNSANAERWYAVSDVAVSREVQAAFMKDFQQAQQRAQGQSAPPTPAAGK